MIDSSCVRVHQRGATAKKGGLDDGCMGRSRGGLTTKIYAVVDAEGRPIALELTAGQAHDSQMALPMLSAMREGTIMLGDKAYDTNALRNAANEKKAWANIPTKSNRKDSFAFSRWVYRQRNLVERFFRNASSASSSSSEELLLDTTKTPSTSWPRSKL